MEFAEYVIKNDGITKYVMGCDPGVSFHSTYYPENDNISVVCSNKSEGAFDILKQSNFK